MRQRPMPRQHMLSRGSKVNLLSPLPDHDTESHDIKKTCPLIPHYYIIEKLGYAGVYLFFLLLLQHIDCGYSLEPPRRCGSNVYPQSMF